MNRLKEKKVIGCLIFVVAFTMMGQVAFAHPGRTDSYGCHTCRTNCSNWGLDSGEYHCHQAKVLPQPLDPIKSHRGDNGTGYTTPAPEYKQPAPISPPVAALKSVTPQKRGFWQWLFGLFGN